MGLNFIYTDKEFFDIGYLMDFTGDFELGFLENASNDFELLFDLESFPDGLEIGSMIYADGSELGGMINSINPSTISNQVKVNGRTFRGKLLDYIKQPAVGEDYYIAQGNANTEIEKIIQPELGDLYVLNLESKSVVNVNYKIRDLSYLEAIEKMLYYSDQNAALDLKFDGRERKVLYNVEIIEDLSNFYAFGETLTLLVSATKTGNFYNKIIALGKGDLKDRVRIILYKTESGEWTQDESGAFYTGLDLKEYKYENTSVETEQELIDSAIEAIASQEVDGIGEVQINEDFLKIGNIVETVEKITGIKVIGKVVSKVVKVEVIKGKATEVVEYKTESEV